MNKEFSEIGIGFKRTLRLLDASEKYSLLFASLLMVATGILTNLPALVLGKLVDSIVGLPNFQFGITLPFIVSIVVIILIREALNVWRKYLVENTATTVEKKETVAVVSHLLKTDIATLNKQQIGSLHGRIFRSIQGFIQLLKLSFLDFLPVFFSAVAAVGIALLQKPLLASVMILVIPSGLFLIVKQVSSQKGIRVALLRGKEKIDGAMVEMLGGIETVRVLNTTSYEVGKIEEISEGLRKKEIRHHIAMAFFDAAKYLNEGFFYILVISLAILFSAQGIISRGDILVYSILFLSITSPLREIHRILDQAHESSIRVGDLYNLLNEPLDISFVSQKSDTMYSSIFLDIKNLSFAYADRTDGVLKNISLSIKKGEKIGIAGASGCGKSTFIKILLRLIHGYSGTITLWGKDLQEVSREDIARNIAYVPQKPYIFSGTIQENIVYGLDKDISKEALQEALKKANIYQEIMKSLGGLEGKVTENGNNLSGGQRQRLAIARVILQSPELLIFDEATSALDNTNEAVIQKESEKLFKDKTIITIAHRLTTLKNADRILVFDNGSIVQEGTYRQLSEKKGLFQQFLTAKQ